VIVLDCLKPVTHKRLIEHELEGFGIRLNKKPPLITYRKKDKGGINFTTTIQDPKLDLEGGEGLLAVSFPPGTGLPPPQNPPCTKRMCGLSLPCRTTPAVRVPGSRLSQQPAGIMLCLCCDSESS
jgi:hypothetical protein